MTLPPAPMRARAAKSLLPNWPRWACKCKLQNVEWAQWLSGTYGNKQYDLTMISHVEPLDLGNFAKPDYYWAYDSQEFRDLFDESRTAQPTDRARLLGEAQRLLADDAVHGFLYQPQWVTIANKNLRGLWKDMPIFVNDLSAMHWSDKN